ncbi:MAG: Protein TolB [Firmicutes bacterium]|nr:Protein TolB [candidate division NPL-UPA2 bacterium]
MKTVRWVALGMMLLVLAGCQWLRPEPGPQTFTISSFAWLPANEGLIVAKDVAGEQRLWLVGAPGRGPRRLTNGEHAEFDPAVSPDGRQIAFIGYTAQANRFLALYDRTTKATVRLDLELGGAYPASPMFSPNGRFLSLERVYGAADAHSDVYQDILIYDLQAKLALGVVTQGDTNRLLGFNAASDKLFIWSTFDGHNHSWSFKYDLWEVEIATLAARRLSEGGPVHNASTGHLRPPVPRIVFHTWQAEDINLSIVPVPRDIYVADVNPYRQERIVAGGHASSPRFSPDGRYIVYLQDFLAKGMGLDVFVSGSDGKNPLRLTVSGLPKLSPQWSPDGRRIAFIQIEGESRHALYVMQADGKGLRRIVP